jgi:hypothetical protein
VLIRTESRERARGRTLEQEAASALWLLPPPPRASRQDGRLRNSHRAIGGAQRRSQEEPQRRWERAARGRGDGRGEGSG